MNETEFNALHPQQKRDLLVERGVLIGKFGTGDDSVLIYRVGKIIAEVYFHAYRSDIAAIIAYTDLEGYTGQLEYIKVEHLLQ